MTYQIVRNDTLNIGLTNEVDYVVCHSVISNESVWIIIMHCKQGYSEDNALQILNVMNLHWNREKTFVVELVNDFMSFRDNEFMLLRFDDNGPKQFRKQHVHVTSDVLSCKPKETLIDSVPDIIIEVRKEMLVKMLR